MVTVPSLEDETPLDQYTATASQTDFNFTYMIFATEDIKVYVNNVLKTETTDYVVKQSDGSAIVPADDLPMDGGKIVFNSGLTSGDKVSLSRDIGIKRLTGYKIAGPFRANVVNAELTKLYAIQQQLERDISRSVRLNPSDAEGGTLQLPSGRAGKFLAFDDNGDMIASAGSANGLVVSSYIGTLLDDTTASEAQSTLGISDYAKTLLDDTTASEAQSTLGISTYAKTLLDNTDAATARTTLDAEQKINSLTEITALEDADQLAVSDNSDSNNSKKITYANLKSDLSSNANLIINGQGLIGQRNLSFTSATTPSNSDDTYLLDRMLLLSDGNDIVDVSQETSEVPQGAYSSIKFDVETANKQFAYCQILEAKEAVKIIGGNASLSFKAKKGGSNATLETLRAAIISWDGTEDSVTTDLVATWAGAGTNPTLATNWTYENTPSDLTLTTSFQTFKIENVSIDTSSAKNVAVLIWCDDTDATVGDLAYIGDIKLEEGSIATPYKSESIENIIIKCQRFYEKSYNLDTAIGTITQNGKIMQSLGSNSIGVNTRYGSTEFKITKRSSPTVTVYSIGGNAARVSNASASDLAANTGNIDSGGENGFSVISSASSTTNGLIVQYHYTADAEL